MKLTAQIFEKKRNFTSPELTVQLLLNKQAQTSIQLFYIKDDGSNGALQSHRVHTVKFLEVMGAGKELTAVPCLSRSQGLPSDTFSLLTSSQILIKHCSSVWMSLTISSSRNPQKCWPSCFGEQMLMPCTLIFTPGLKSRQEHGQILQKQCMGGSKTSIFHAHWMEMVQRLYIAWPSAPPHWADKGMKESILNFPFPANPPSPTTLSFPLLSGKTLCYHLPWHYSESPLT